MITEARTLDDERSRADDARRADRDDQLANNTPKFARNCLRLSIQTAGVLTTVKLFEAPSTEEPNCRFRE